MFKNNFYINSILNKLITKFQFSSKSKDSGCGLIYTLYSDKLNLIELGYVRNNKILEEKIKNKNFILLDKKSGNYFDSFLLKKTLRLLDIQIYDDKYCDCNIKTLRHLMTLGWPIGNSLYKKRIIRKKISYVYT